MQAGPKPIITTAEVAAQIGMTRQAFYLQRGDLIENHAFPLPLPYRGAMRWRRDMVEAWLQEQGRPKMLPPSPRPQGPNVHLLEMARRA